MLSRLFPCRKRIYWHGIEIEIREATYKDLAFFESWAMDTLGDPLKIAMLIEDKNERCKELKRIYTEYKFGYSIDMNDEVSERVYCTEQGVALQISTLTNLSYDESLSLVRKSTSKDLEFITSFFQSRDIWHEASKIIDDEIGLTKDHFEEGVYNTFTEIAICLMKHPFNFSIEEVSNMTIGQSMEILTCDDDSRYDRNVLPVYFRKAAKLRGEFHKKYGSVGIPNMNNGSNN